MADSLNTVAVNPTTQSWIGCGVGTSTQPAATPAQCAAINALLPRFFGSIPRTLGQELYFGKLDYHLTTATPSAPASTSCTTSPNGIQTAAASTTGSAINGNGDDAVTVRNGRPAWTFIPTSNFVNEFRFGVATDRQADTLTRRSWARASGTCRCR